MSKQPPPAPTVSAVGPCPAPSHHPTYPSAAIKSLRKQHLMILPVKDKKNYTKICHGNCHTGGRILKVVLKRKSDINYK